jgi:2-C-methyl-D-erythritol 2,4-cyclodiphosphate synthase
LGGVKVPFDKGLKGHSDGDAAAHAVIDALLGAAALGDIGTLFPDSDARYKGADSLRLLQEARRRLGARFQIQNIDVTLFAEAPRLGPYKQRMRVKLAHALKVPVDRVSVKAKTNEGMGFIGRREGLAAVAVAAVKKRS